jgi:hypothetical protein
MVLAALLIYIGPFIFKLFNYEISEKKSIKESNAVSYFLQVLIAVVIGFLALSK